LALTFVAALAAGCLARCAFNFTFCCFVFATGRDLLEDRFSALARMALFAAAFLRATVFAFDAAALLTLAISHAPRL
jgi:hypothetical protein